MTAQTVGSKGSGGTKEQAWWREPTRDQWAAFAASWSGWVLDAFDFTIYLLVLPDIAKHFGVSLTAATGSLTLTLLVRLLGSFVAGSMADRWGRKLPLMLSLVWFAVFDGAVALAPSFTWILILRTLFGFGMGAEWTAGATLAMENWPARSRGIASGILQGSWAIGYLLAAGVAAFVVPRWGWRGLFVVAAFPALLVLPIRALVKESDEWRHAVKTRTTSSWRELVAPGQLRLLIGGSVVMGLGFAVYYALTAAYPAMLVTEHNLGSGARMGLVALFNVGMLIGAAVLGTIAKRRGVTVAVALPALLMLPALPLYVGAVPGTLEIGAFLAGALGVGYCGIVPMFLTGMFPAHMRARSVGLVYHVGSCLAAFVPPLLTYLAQATSLSLGTSIMIVAGAAELILAIAVLATRPQAAVDAEPEAEPQTARAA